MFQDRFCVLHMRNEPIFIFDRLYLMTHVSSGNGKGVIFRSLDSSFMWCEQFCLGSTFYFDDFYFIGKPLWSHLNTVNIRWHCI